MTLEEKIKALTPSRYVKVIVNNKFSLFNCIKTRMKDSEHMEYMQGFMRLPVMFTESTYYYTYNCVKLYVHSQALEDRCMMLENLWYDSENKYMNRKEVNVW